MVRTVFIYSRIYSDEICINNESEALLKHVSHSFTFPMHNIKANLLIDCYSRRRQRLKLKLMREKLGQCQSEKCVIVNIKILEVFEN